MKVAILTYALKIGGVERVILNLYKGLESQGYEPVVYEIMAKGEWSDKFKSMGLRVHRILPRPWESKKKHALRMLSQIKAYPLIFLNDVQYAHSILGFLPKSSRVFPIIHGNLESMLRNASFNGSQIQKIICVNPILAQRLNKEYGVKPEKLHVIPNCLDTSADQVVFSQKKDRFIYLGRLNDFEKGVMDLPEIIRLILPRLPLVQLDVFGSGTHEEPLRQKIKEYGLEKTISLKGELPLEQVNPTLAQYKYLLFPSKFESGALVLKEAMLNGLIAFAYRLEGQTDDIIAHGKNGFMAEPARVTELAAQIIEVLEQPESHSSLSENARQTILERFSLQAMMNEYLAVIREGLEASDPQRSHRLEPEILEEFPSLPLFLIRPLRKSLRVLGLYHEK
ncbi:glycosyltransferase family 4 protein [Algoriphagus confluentis]|uniref:Glycosyltransferase n=1 Tax=Algoriphagus confluentis TaxID=1697556 RepID=A0ABQ6PNK3_9BACT|nr:hypothetical protein Aconfl_21830 [Algoriphagus confluentis]